MKRELIYFYRGENGSLTTPILIPPETRPTVYVLLTADEGKMLTNGSYKTKSIQVPQEGVHNWTEVDE